MQKKRDDITKALLEMVQNGRCEERYMDSVYDAVDMPNAHKDEMEYDYCPFCGEKKWRYRKRGYLGNKVIEWFICIDCEREVI